MNSIIPYFISSNLKNIAGINLLYGEKNSEFKPNNPFYDEPIPELVLNSDSFENNSQKSKDNLDDQDEKISGWLFIMKPKSGESLKLEDTISEYASLRVNKLFSSDNPDSIQETKKSNFFNSKNKSNLTKNSKHSFLCYATLKGETILLYDSEKKSEGFGTIVLSQYKVSLGYVDEYRETRIYSKKTPILLEPAPTSESSRSRTNSAPDKNSSKNEISYCIFTLQSTKKEDWYFAISSTILSINPNPLSRLQKSCYSLDWDQVKSVIDKRLSESSDTDSVLSSSDVVINALIGRLVLGTIHTKKVHDYMLSKIIKKFDSLILPSIIDNIQVLNLSIGDNIPILSKSKLSKYGDNGQVSFESFIDYPGGLTILMQVTVKVVNVKFPINFGVKVKGLKGDAILALKQSPSDRFWVGFKELPEIDLEIEPVFMQKKIKVKKIIDILRNKMFESFRSSFVLPNMSDNLFFIPNSKSKGGIFENDLHSDTFELPAELTSSLSSAQSPLIDAQQPTNSTLAVEPNISDPTNLTKKLTSFLKKNQDFPATLSLDKEQGEIIQKIKNEQNKRLSIEKNKQGSWSFKSLLDIEKIPIDSKLNLTIDNSSLSNKNATYKTAERRNSLSSNSLRSTTSLPRNSISSYIGPSNKSDDSSFKGSSQPDFISETIRIEDLLDSKDEIPDLLTSKSSPIVPPLEKSIDELILDIPVKDLNPPTLPPRDSLLNSPRPVNDSSSSDSRVFTFPNMSKSTFSSTLSSNDRNLNAPRSSEDLNQMQLLQQMQYRLLKEKELKPSSPVQNSDDIIFSTKQIAKGIKSSVISGASELYKNAKQSSTAESAMKWLMKHSKNAPKLPSRSDSNLNNSKKSITINNDQSQIQAQTQDQTQTQTQTQIQDSSPTSSAVNTISYENPTSIYTTAVSPKISSKTLPDNSAHHSPQVENNSISGTFLIPESGEMPVVTEPPKLPIRIVKAAGKTKVEDFKFFD
ncbi:hypothetical protein AYI69_g11471 [Smittium culicis]|uniref:SMP-LTD domain-containing protein n=1 Tax=Smittium culicis TaxID=133412 RepID=A0A1R1WYC9_9FUNG|nr:hypothetical protein AYI69_g11471 [Smittium culicis]